jgi:flagellar protein FliS
MTSRAMRDRYLADSVTTASPGQLVVMLYDRLALDVAQAEITLRAGNRQDASRQLQHAQEIVLELRASLDISAWPGADALSQLYSFLLIELMSANVRGDAGRVSACLTIVEPLRDAWRQAALIIAQHQAVQHQPATAQAVG